MKIENFLIALKKIFEEKAMLLFWNILLFSGGVIFLSYFMHIQYVPELELDSVVLLFASGSIIAGTIIFFLCLILIIPGLIWDSAISSFELLLEIREKSQNDYTQKIIWWFGVPSIFAVLCLHLYFFKNKIIFWVVISSSILGYFIALCRCRPRKLRFALLGSWISGAIFFFLPLMILYGMASKAALQNNFQDWTKIVLSVSFIVASNSSILLRPIKQKKIIWVTIVSLFSLVYITMIIGSWSFIPQLIFTNTKLGNIENVQIIINHDGCTIFQLYKVEVDYLKNEGICLSKSPVTILSRIGKNYYIETRRKDNKKINFTLPSDSVKSWSIAEAKVNEKEKK